VNLLKNRSKSLFGPLSLVFVLATSPTPVVLGLTHPRTPENQEDGRGLRVQPLKPVEALPTGSKRFALVIGVDEYEDSQINRLEGAGNDAKAIVEALVQYADFPRDQVRLLTSDQPAERKPTRNKILRQLSNLRGAVPKDGLLLIAFAGHGIERGGQAYLLPSDAELSDDVSLLEQSSINVDEMRKRILETGVAQVVMILDACRNDPAAGRGDSDNRLSSRYTRAFNFEERNSDIKAFATLYATAVGYRAYEYKERKQGYFTWALVEGLKGAAANEKGEVTLNGLLNFLQDQVPKRILLDLGSGKVQKPYADIQGYKASDLVLAKVAAAENVAIADPYAVERTAWESAQSKNDPTAYLEYMKKFPGGMFSERATWETIRGSADPADFKNYLKQFPSGKNASLATRLGEDATWERIKNSKNVSDYQAYLREYPNGRFTEIAVRRTQPPPVPIKGDSAPQKPSRGILTVLTNTPATVVVKPRDPSSVKPLTGQSGGQDNKFRAELPPGVYDLEVSAAKYSPKKVPGIRLETDEAIPVELVPLGGIIQIGGVEPTATVLIDDQKPTNAIPRREEKLIELADVAAGRHRLRVNQPNQIEWNREVEVEDGRTKYVAAEFKAALVGLVVSTEADAEIYIDDNYSGRTNDKGQIKISNLAPGQHTIRATKNEFQPAEKAQPFRAGPAEISLALNRVVFSPEFVDTFDEGVRFWNAPKTWQVSSGKLRVKGPGLGLIKDTSYKDFRMEFDLIFDNGKGAAWFLRGQDENTGYLFQLTGQTSASPNMFQTFLCRNGETKLLKVFRVPERLNVPGDRYHIIIEAQGQEIKHYLQVKSNPNATRPQPFSLVSDATFSNGRIGFGTRDGEEFIVQFVSIIPTK
jgi:uncharacterized caspase-like protein